jgi:uncharacterized protein YecE (DUF72 family)
VTIHVGTCGYQYYDPGDDWQERYESKLQAHADQFPVGELNRTFYSLPMVSTTERWREEAGDDFEFIVKAWQAMTHPWSSPTWNDHRDDILDEDTDDVGHLQPTDVLMNAWQATKKRAEALEARVVVLQTPPGFGATEEHAENMRALFDRIDRDGLTLAWEPRGTWLENLDWVGDLCDDLDLVHVVDLFRDEPRSRGDLVYVRLHGRNEDRYDYDYAYDTADLEDLADRLQDLHDDHEDVYCLFNNYEMYGDATELLALLS